MFDFQASDSLFVDMQNDFLFVDVPMPASNDPEPEAENYMSPKSNASNEIFFDVGTFQRKCGIFKLVSAHFVSFWFLFQLKNNQIICHRSRTLQKMNSSIQLKNHLIAAIQLTGQTKPSNQNHLWFVDVDRLIGKTNRFQLWSTCQILQCELHP